MAITLDGNSNVSLAFSSGGRITGDYTNATLLSRAMFQTSTTNGSTGIYALPNGTSTAASWQATNAADPTNASKILIATNGSTDCQLVSGRNGTGTYLPLTFYTNGSEQMRLDTSGNLGLGVTPSAWSGFGQPVIEMGAAGSVFTGGTGGTNVYYNAYYNGGYKYARSAGAAYYNIGSGAHYWYNAPSGTAGAAISFTQAMTLDASGNLGIGATANERVMVASSSSASYIQICDSSTGTTSGDGLFLGSFNGFSELKTKENTSLAFGTNNTERARIDSSGNLLVGTTSFTNSNNKGLAVWFSSATNSGGEGSIEFRNTSTSTNSDPNPVLGIYKGSATTTSAQRFVQFYCSAGAQAMGGIVGNGATNVQFVSLSDAREKTNINPIAGSLAKLLTLKPSSFDWVATGEHINAGFVAQDVLEVFPEFVVDNISNEGQEQRYGLTGGMTGGIIPHLVKAIQELNQRLEALENK